MMPKSYMPLEIVLEDQLRWTKQPLLAMFTIKGRHYKVEYEGLHLLCLNCGVFGHYVEGCPKKGMENSKTSEYQRKDSGNKGEQGQQKVEERLWTVVQKQRRPRKQKDNGTSGVNGEPNFKGSRFTILETEENNQESNNNSYNLGEKNMERIVAQKEQTRYTRGENKKQTGGSLTYHE
jgi:hypothetical protein